MAGEITPYARHSRFTDPARLADRLEALPFAVPAICQAIQGLFLHVHELGLYGVEVPDSRRRADEERAEAVIEAVVELDDRPLTEPRPLDRRLGVCCRQHALLACSALRQRGVPARVRSGFVNYLAPSWYSGHTVCQWWHAGEGRWVTFDAQIDDVQRQAKGITFSTLDLRTDHFLCGSLMWLWYRAGTVDTAQVLGGPANLRNAVVLDLWEATLQETHRARCELMPDTEAAPTGAQLDRLDALAEAIVSAEASLPALQDVMERFPDARPDRASR